MHVNVFIINNFNATEFFLPANGKIRKATKQKQNKSCSLEHSRKKSDIHSAKRSLGTTVQFLINAIL